jgi:hypothetical protein
MTAKINTILFFLLITAGMTSYFIIKPKRISIEEKRKLTVFPELTWNSYVSGKWADSIDRYLNDHFPNRLKMVEYATSVRYARGVHFKNQEKIFVYQKPKRRSNPGILFHISSTNSKKHTPKVCSF